MANLDVLANLGSSLGHDDFDLRMTLTFVWLWPSYNLDLCVTITLNRCLAAVIKVLFFKVNDILEFVSFYGEFTNVLFVVLSDGFDTVLLRPRDGWRRNPAASDFIPSKLSDRATPRTTTETLPIALHRWVIDVAIYLYFPQKYFPEQECITVGCVPPARYRTGGLSPGDLPNRDPPGQRPPWTKTILDREPLDRHPLDRTGRQTPPGQNPLTETPRQRPPWTDTPWTETPDRAPPSVMWPVVLAGTETPCGQNSWHTLLKTLPCRNFVAGGNNYTKSWWWRKDSRKAVRRDQFSSHCVNEFDFKKRDRCNWKVHSNFRSFYRMCHEVHRFVDSYLCCFNLKTYSFILQMLGHWTDMLIYYLE